MVTLLTLFPIGGLQLSEYYSQVKLPVASGASWRTIEYAFVPGTTIDPATGKPYFDFLLNVYANVSVGSNGYRSGDLVSSYRGVSQNVDQGGKVDVTSTTVPYDYGLYTQGTQGFTYVDNFAVGPLINTPEPGTATAVVWAAGISALRRRRSHKNPDHRRPHQ
jgi:hypothetical protein